MLKTYFVYILLCKDKSYYTGVTSSVYRPIEHDIGKYARSYTAKRRPVQLVYYEESNDINAAIYREKQIKGWSRKKKEALINSKYNLLKKLSKRKSVQDNDE